MNKTKGMQVIQKIQFHGAPCNNCGELCATGAFCTNCFDPMDERLAERFPGLYEISETVHDYLLSDDSPSLGMNDIDEIRWIIGEISWYAYQSGITANQAIFKILW